jgi:FixJ family two-component response regulator
MHVIDSGRIHVVAVVDDDENLRRSFARLLRAAGMRAITYASAEAFLSDTAKPNLDCLVLDVHLPGMSGIELQERLQATGNATQILFITAYDDVGARQQAYAMGCAGYFRKSDSGREVLNAIKGLVAPRPDTS